MSTERLLRYYNVQYMAEGHKHCTAGWVNVHCPFCPGSQDYHMGIREELIACHCWRCGGHPIVETLGRVLGLPIPEVWRVLSKYKGTAGAKKTTAEPRVSIHPFKFPKPYSPLNKQGKRYLEKRGFDADHLEAEWELLQTGPVSFLDGISYSNRILIPIYWDGKIVSFQARDITERSDRKYLACPMRREEIHHKNILYGKQEFWAKSQALIIVEGVTDVWKLGPSAVATFGTSFKTEQVLHLAKYHNRFFIVFDDEPQAQEQARKLSVKLKTLGKTVWIEKVKEDPGSMTQEDANHLVKGLK